MAIQASDEAARGCRPATSSSTAASVSAEPADERALPRLAVEIGAGVAHDDPADEGDQDAACVALTASSRADRPIPRGREAARSAGPVRSAPGREPTAHASATSAAASAQPRHERRAPARAAEGRRPRPASRTRAQRAARDRGAWTDALRTVAGDAGRLVGDHVPRKIHCLAIIVLFKERYERAELQPPALFLGGRARGQPDPRGRAAERVAVGACRSRSGSSRSTSASRCSSARHAARADGSRPDRARPCRRDLRGRRGAAGHAQRAAARPAPGAAGRRRWRRCRATSRSASCVRCSAATTSRSSCARARSASCCGSSRRTASTWCWPTCSPPRDAATPWISHAIAEQPVSLVGTPERTGGSAPLEDLLAREPLILPTVESSIRIGFDALLDRLGIRPRIAAEVDDMAMIRLLAREGIGLAVVPPIVVKDELASGRARRGRPVSEAEGDVLRRDPVPAVSQPASRKPDQGSRAAPVLKGRGEALEFDVAGPRQAATSAPFCDRAHQPPGRRWGSYAREAAMEGDPVIHPCECRCPPTPSKSSRPSTATTRSGARRRASSSM